MTMLDSLLFWKTKTPSDNEWHPRPDTQPPRDYEHITEKQPRWLQRVDVEAAVVDVAPFVAGAGSLAHFSQLNSLGWTVPASIFRNRRTMIAMHHTALYLFPVVLICQAAGFEYRYFIPRWCHDRERRRDETEVRHQVMAGGCIGLVGWALRLYAFKAGRAYWAPVLEPVMAGALADLAHREYVKAHGF